MNLKIFRLPAQGTDGVFTRDYFFSMPVLHTMTLDVIGTIRLHQASVFRYSLKFLAPHAAPGNHDRKHYS